MHCHLEFGLIVCLGFAFTEEKIRLLKDVFSRTLVKSSFISDLQEATIEQGNLSGDHQESADPGRYDDDNWETFSEKSFSTVRYILLTGVKR